MERIINLIVVPGPGKCQVRVSDTHTWNQLIMENSTHMTGREIVANGRAVPPSQYGTVIGTNIVDVYATVSVKGN